MSDTFDPLTTPTPDDLPPAVPVAPAPLVPPQQRGRRIALIAGAGVATAVVAGAGVAFGIVRAAPASANTTQLQLAGRPGKDFHGHPGFGRFDILTVQSVSGATITATDRKGATITVVTTSATKIMRAGATTTLSALTKNEHIVVRGTLSADGKTITATDIAVVLPGVHGTVAKVSGDTLTITTPKGAQTVTLTASTTFVKDANQTATRADITVGTAIEAQGTLNSDGSLTAETVHIISPHVAGKVASVSGDTITVTTRQGTTIVYLTAATTVHKGRQTAAQTDIAVGDMILATGTKNADGSLTASNVVIAQPMTVGKIAAINGQTLTITTPKGSETVKLTATTTITDGLSGTAVAASSLKTGEYVLVEGTRNSDGSFTATALHVLASLPAMPGGPGFPGGPGGGFGGHGGPDNPGGAPGSTTPGI